jgi:hypothetical protein
MEHLKKFNEKLYSTTIGILNEHINHKMIGYHISQYNFVQFDSSVNIGNFGTILDGSYFLNEIKGIDNFGSYGYLYTVEITPKNIFRFDLRTDDHWYLSTEFQELFSESLAGISNYLDDFFNEQNVSADNIDCIILTNLDYVHNKNSEEYIVLNDEIIQIIKKEIVE